MISIKFSRGDICVEEKLPAPAPEMAMPPIKTFMVLAVLDTIRPRHTSVAPRIATYRRPSRSDRLPTNGQIPARASRFARTYIACMLALVKQLKLIVCEKARTNQIQRSAPPMDA